MNYLVSHPRSGRSWQRTRLLYFFRKILSKKNIDAKTLDKIVHLTHMGFERADPVAGFFPIENFLKVVTPQDNITLLLRRAEAIITSYWFYLKAKHPASLTKKEHNDLDAFVKSSLGCPRVKLFMQNVKRLHKRHKLRILYYEDAFSLDFCHNIPLIAGSDYRLSEQEAKAILMYSKDNPKGQKRIGTSDSYKRTMSELSQKRIKEAMKTTKFSPYIDRYSDD